MHSVSQPLNARQLRRVTLIMSAASGVAVANMYYCQPLLGLMARSFHVTEAAINWVATLTQIGTALGMLLFVPLGDILERRGLIVRVSLLGGLTALVNALVPNYTWLLLSSALVGLTAIVPHLILPFSAHLAPETQRGKTLGTVVSGLLVGILLARVLAGMVGADFGWRSVYGIAAGLMAITAWVLGRSLPQHHPAHRMSYVQLQRSVLELVRASRVVREASFSGAMLFGGFQAFWTTLTFFLATPPYHYGARLAGAFGLVAAGSAALVPLVGKWIDRHSPRWGVTAGIVLTLVSFVVLAAFGHHLWGIAAGVVLLDFGVQTGHVSNQARMYGALPHARSRAATAYMVSYFLGGSLGALLGGLGWQHFGWLGACAAGFAMVSLAMVMQWLTRAASDSGPDSRSEEFEDPEDLEDEPRQRSAGWQNCESPTSPQQRGLLHHA